MRRGILSGNDIIIFLEGKGIDYINVLDLELTEIVGESRIFLDEIIEFILSIILIISKGLFYRRKVTFICFYD